MTPAPDNNKYSKFSCPNPECPFFNQFGQNNITHRSWSGKDKNIQRLRCKRCKKEFSQREGSLMAKTKLPQATILMLLKCQRWGVCDAGSADICEVDITKPFTVSKKSLLNEPKSIMNKWSKT